MTRAARAGGFDFGERRERRRAGLAGDQQPAVDEREGERGAADGGGQLVGRGEVGGVCMVSARAHRERPANYRPAVAFLRMARDGILCGLAGLIALFVVVAGLRAVDFACYAFHRLSHRLRLLWIEGLRAVPLNPRLMAQHANVSFPPAGADPPRIGVHGFAADEWAERRRDAADAVARSAFVVTGVAPGQGRHPMR